MALAMGRGTPPGAQEEACGQARSARHTLSLQHTLGTSCPLSRDAASDGCRRHMPTSVADICHASLPCHICHAAHSRIPSRPAQALRWTPLGPAPSSRQRPPVQAVQVSSHAPSDAAS
eukprot:4866373-Prymnesium_polylepis.1